jgi:hypothetical protein
MQRRLTLHSPGFALNAGNRKDHHMTTIRFDAAEYVRSHFAQPRGRGCWAFRIGRDEIYWAPGNSTLTEAKAWLRDAVQAMPNMPRFVVANIMP